MCNTDDPVLDILLAYAGNDDNIRAVLLEGSRAFGEADAYSDYDIVYVTNSSEPYFGGAVLPFLTENFGEIAVMQTPDNGDPHDCYTHLVQFASGLRIDLTFNAIAFLERVLLESATLVLMDKDGRFANTPPPSDADFWLSPPDEAAYRRHCNEFWWCAPYVAKAATRGQLLHALELLNGNVRKEYAWMLCRLAGARHDWQRVSPGKHGDKLKNLLPAGDLFYYETLLGSYTPADEQAIRLALDSLMRAYAPLAAAVAEALGYPHDAAEPEKTMRFIQDRFERPGKRGLGPDVRKTEGKHAK